jgi:UDP-N-acetylglucosamine 2-epimerase (non-hydrolysing)
MSEKVTVPIVVGTRPEAIKLVPIILALRESRSFHPIVVSTGQHHKMVDEVFGLAGITTDVQLWSGGLRARLNDRVATVMRRFEDFAVEMYGEHDGQVAPPSEVLSGRFPAAVLVHGDTSSAMAAALASFHLRIPVMHVEAGLRSGSNLSPFPEEMNREVISCIACFHFAPTEANQEHLVREDVPASQIFVTGNSGIDALHWAVGLEVPFSDPKVEEAATCSDRLVVVTAHRRESWGGGLHNVAEGVAAIARTHPDVRVVVPLHPNPRVREEMGGPLAGLDNVLLTEPLGYAEFARLLSRATLVVTDSGGIQEEAPSLGKPVLVARETTERTEGVVAGTLKLVGTDPGRIALEGGLLLDDARAYRRMATAPNPYGDGHAAQRIVAALEQLRHGGPPPEPFGAGYTRHAVLAAAGYEAGLGHEGLEPGEPGEPAGEERGTDEEPVPVETLWPT